MPVKSALFSILNLTQEWWTTAQRPALAANRRVDSGIRPQFRKKAAPRPTAFRSGPRQQRVTLYQEILARLADEDLETWGHSRKAIAAELDRIDLAGNPAPRPKLTRYALERRVLVAIRRQIQPGNALGGLVKKVREVCDVLLR